VLVVTGQSIVRDPIGHRQDLVEVDPGDSHRAAVRLLLLRRADLLDHLVEHSLRPASGKNVVDVVRHVVSLLGVVVVTSA
jgi:hypothetical protein